MLTPDRNQITRDYLHDLVCPGKISKKMLEARGINPPEAKARIDSLSDDELEMISQKINDLPDRRRCYRFCGSYYHGD